MAWHTALMVSATGGRVVTVDDLLGGRRLETVQGPAPSPAAVLARFLGEG